MTDKPRRFSIGLTLWLLLTVAVANLWMRSYLLTDSVRMSLASDLLDCSLSGHSCRGTAGMEVGVRFGPHPSRRMDLTFNHYESLPPDPANVRQNPQATRWLGFEFLGGTNGIEVQVPFWFILILLILLLARGVYRGRIRRNKRLRAGLCLACGYDLRASTERCPECGTAIPAEMPRAKEVAT